jgi:hypothetical protein
MRPAAILLMFACACDHGLPTEPVSLTGSWVSNWNSDTFQEILWLSQRTDGTLCGRADHSTPAGGWQRDLLAASVEYPKFSFAIRRPTDADFWVTTCDSLCRFTGHFTSADDVVLTSVDGYPFGQGGFERGSSTPPPGC